MNKVKKYENIIEVKNIKKIYRMGSERIIALDDVSFSVKKGEFCCLYGVSGSGKSTLLNLLAGIEKASSGQIIIKGRNIHRMSEKSLARFRQNSLGFVFQSYNLLNSMTAQENVELPLMFKHVRTKKRKRMARDMLIKVGLGSRLKHKPKEMSGGQQQRVGIARAFVSNPEIVFADEPTGNLDSKTTKEVMDIIKNMARANNQTIVLVTHDRRLAEYADKIIHIFDGKIESIEINEANEAVEADEETEAVGVMKADGVTETDGNTEKDGETQAVGVMEADEVADAYAATKADGAMEADEDEEAFGVSEADEVTENDVIAEIDAVLKAYGAPKAD